MNIGVLDYGAGNLKNVCRAIEHLGYRYKLLSSVDDFQNVDKLVIPGVGAYKVAMDQLIELGLIESIKLLSEKGVPILGICLGMQLLFEESSEYGRTQGLGLLRGHVDSIPLVSEGGERIKVPHIGWNELIIDNLGNDIVEGICPDDAVYFVHSFKANVFDKEDLIAHCVYGDQLLPSVVNKKNIFGCQFHPEKSGGIGLKIFNNFLK